MVVVDLRSFFTVRNVELIEVNHDFIYYAEEKNEEGHNNLFLLEYNRVTRRERVVTHYSLDNPTYVQHIYSFADSLVLLLENGGSTVWVFRIDKNTGEETARAQLNCIGAFAGCRALDKRHVLVYTEANEEFAGLFREYQKVTGCSRVAYLYDIEQEKKYFIKDVRLCQRSGEDFYLYTTAQGRQVLMLEPYGDEALKERCYRNARWINTDIRDNLWVLPLQKLICAVKRSEEHLVQKPIVSAGITGLARYCGMDERHIYFRARHFPTQQERVCRYDKHSGEIEGLADLEQAPDKKWRYYEDIPSAKLYRLEEKEETVRVKGIVNSSIDTEYERKLGDFVACMEDRFLITRKIVTNDQGDYEFEYNSIFDSEKKTEESFECKCSVWDNTMVLY